MKTKTNMISMAGFLIFLACVLVLFSFGVKGQSADIGGGMGIQITVIDNPDDPVPDSGDDGSGYDNSGQDDDSEDNNDNSNSYDDDNGGDYFEGHVEDDLGTGSQGNENLMREIRQGKIELNFNKDVKESSNKEGKFVIAALLSSTTLLLILLLLLVGIRFTNLE